MCAMLPSFQVELAGSGRDDGGTRADPGPHNDHAPGAGFCAEIRAALESLTRQSGDSWRVDETHIKIRGVWTYLYRADDRMGRTVDFRLSPRRDVTAAKLLFRKALRTQGRPPRAITLDGYAASHRAVRELPEGNPVWNNTKLRSSSYLNNMIEQDHRTIKTRIAPMLSFRRF
jgi:transposase-like protein